MTRLPTRREALRALSVLPAATAMLPFLAGGEAVAADKKAVIGTWGGDYARLLKKHIEDPFLAPRNLEIVQDHAADSPRRAKMFAERRLPRGTSDIQALSSANLFELHDAGILESLDYAKIPNAKNLLPLMKYPYGIGQIYSGMVVVYNPKLITPAPKSFKDAFDPRHGNKIGFIDIQYQYTMAAAALGAGGSMTDLEPGKALLLAAKSAGARIYPTNESFAQALKTEEIAIGIMWKARAVQWQNAGIPVEPVTPSEGILLYISGFGIPKNAPNKDAAYAYLDAALERKAQESFAVDMGYNPTINNAEVAPDLQKRIGFTAEEQKQLKDLDYAFFAKQDSAMKEWWDKSFKG